MPHKRLSVEERTIYKALPIGKSPVITLNVNGDKWKVVVNLVWFKTDEKGTTYHLGNVLVEPPIKNMINRLKHHFPHLKLTEKELIALIKDSIVKGIFEQGKKDEAKIFLTLDSWMQLKPLTAQSKLITTTPSRYRRLVLDEDEVITTYHRKR